jgi:hypothetical protein
MEDIKQDVDFYATIDPGLGGTGLAIWDKNLLHPVNTYAITVGAIGDWLQRAQTYGIRLDMAIKKEETPIQKIYIEYPRLMATASGMASAERGDVFKLMFLVGVYAEVCWRNGLEFVPLPVNTWKGTMSKEVVAKRILQRLGENAKFPNHTEDAVGMGIYLKGLMNISGTVREKPKGKFRVLRRKPN